MDTPAQQPQEDERQSQLKLLIAKGKEQGYLTYDEVNDNMPEGKKNVGSPGYGGPMVTAGGLVFIGATRDRRFRAFESRTGKELWSTRFDYNVTAIPITYMGRNGKQYVAVTAATQGQGNNESLHVFALPSFAPRASEDTP